MPIQAYRVKEDDYARLWVSVCALCGVGSATCVAVYVVVYTSGKPRFPERVGDPTPGHHLLTFYHAYVCAFLVASCRDNRVGLVLCDRGVAAGHRFLRRKCIWQSGSHVWKRLYTRLIEGTCRAAFPGWEQGCPTALCCVCERICLTSPSGEVRPHLWKGVKPILRTLLLGSVSRTAFVHTLLEKR